MAAGYQPEGVCPGNNGKHSSGVDILIHLGRMRDKSRKVLEITEICGFENHEIKTRTLYRWQEGKGLVQTAELLNREKLIRAGVTI